MIYQVKDISAISGVSIRTLHHYDEIGLLKPRSTTVAGYREYSDAELSRLQQIMFFRELDFSLSEIKKILDDPTYDRDEALTMHRKLLMEKRRRINALIKTVDRTLSGFDENPAVRNNEQMFAGFDETKMNEYKEEARQRWGSSEAWEQSEVRTASYGQSDWDSIKEDIDRINQSIASRMTLGVSDEQVQAAVSEWHALINERFYTCTKEVFAGLGEMYVSDSRFNEHYEKIAPGLAVFLRDAIRVYVEK